MASPGNQHCANCIGALSFFIQIIRRLGVLLISVFSYRHRKRGGPWGSGPLVFFKGGGLPLNFALGLSHCVAKRQFRSWILTLIISAILCAAILVYISNNTRNCIVTLLNSLALHANYFAKPRNLGETYRVIVYAAMREIEIV